MKLHTNLGRKKRAPNLCLIYLKSVDVAGFARKRLPEKFSDSILSFLENSDGRYVFKHFSRETNLGKKHSVSYGNGNSRAHLKKRK